MTCRFGHFALGLAVTFQASSALAEGASANDTAVADRPSIEEVLSDVPLVDGHNDLIMHYIDFEAYELLPIDAYDIRKTQSGQSDLPRMRDGGLGGAIFTIWTPDDKSPEPGLEKSIDLFQQIARQNPRNFAIVTSPDELLAAHAAGQIGIILGLEGGDPVEGNLGRLRWMQDRGVSEMGLVWSTNGIGIAGRTSEDGGLTELGRDVVREMNRLGLIIDLSHAAYGTVRDVTEISTAPVIDTHAYSTHFTTGTGIATDLSMKAIAETGGLIMPMFMPEATNREFYAWQERREEAFRAAAIVTMGDAGKDYPSFLPWPPAIAENMEVWLAQNPPPQLTIADMADVYDHVRQIVGIDHIGIGSDFDGMGFHPTSRHPALGDVSKLPDLLAELRRRGWSDQDLRQLAGENFLRVWRQIRAAAETPSTGE